jgi:starch-binding outer membrane protein SusE/F
VAYLAGIPSLGTGNLYWTVYSTKGLNVVQSSQTRVMTVTRPAGFANIPASVYLTGSATEGGTTLANAIPMKETSSGVFELYTSLTSGGSYQFVDRNSGTPTVFSISGANLVQGGTTAYTDTTAQVRFRLNFNDAGDSITVIRSIGVFFSQFDSVTYVLSYGGNSTWVDNNVLVQLPAVSYGLEDRYKFTFTVNYGGGIPDSYETYGSSNYNNNEPTSTTPLSYWYLYPVTNDQWDYTFKFDASTNNGVLNNFTVYLQANGAYTHSVVPQ